MSQELHYTSMPRGLKPGSRGFCAVGLTPHMQGSLLDRLEALSGYQPVFPPHDPSAALNPITFSHLRLTIGGKLVNVLSRIGPAGLDYSGRPNKYAHHVVLDGNERPVGGPAWLLSQPGFMQTAWEGDPSEISVGRTPPQQDREAGMAHAWQALTGDGGWAGVLAEAFLNDPRRTVFLVFRPGMELMPLFVEASALLPASRRWEVDFSTYFSQLPQGVTCAWRGVLESSEEAKIARRLPGALALDLCGGLGRADGGQLVRLARTGERSGREHVATPTRSGSGRHIPGIPRDPAEAVIDASRQSRENRPANPRETCELLPELAKLVAGERSSPMAERVDPIQRLARPSLIVAILVAACLIPMAFLRYAFKINILAGAMGLQPEISKDIAVERARVAEAKKLGEADSARKFAQSESERLERALVPNAMPNNTTEQPQARNEVHVPEAPESKSEPKKSAMEDRKDKASGVVFFELPSIQGSGLRDIAPALSAKMEVKPVKEIVSLNLINSADFLIQEDQETEYQILPRTAGVLGSAAVARLQVKGNVLSFTWLDAGKRASSSTAVRDCALKVTGPDHTECVMLLRNPNISHHQAFDLTNTPEKAGHRPSIRDDYKRRELSVAWAEMEPIAGTNWDLGIRRWKITSRLRPQSAETIIVEGIHNQSAPKVQQDIIPGEVAITLAIERGSPHLIRVLLEFSNQAIRIRDERRALLKRHQHDMRELENLQKEPRGSESLESEIQDLKKTIARNMPKVEECTRNETIVRHLSESQQTKLSLVISIRLDEATVIDIAKYGDFVAVSP